MKQTLMILLLIASFSVTAGSYLILPIDKIYDGDTISTHVSINRLPAPLNQLYIRIVGIDTPEMPASSYLTTGLLGRAKCKIEADLALSAKQAVVDLAKSSKTMKVTNFQWDKFGGRIDATVEINGINVANYLISKGLAVKYNGEAKTHNWCNPV